MEAAEVSHDQGDIFSAFRCGKTDPARRQHLIILTAIEEMIEERKQQQQQQQQSPLSSPSANEYFAAIMTALEAQDQSHTPELVCLMETVMGHVDRAFLRAKFKPIAQVLTTLLKTNLDHEMTAFVRDLVTCLGKLLVAQEVSSGLWSAPSTLKTFYVILSRFRDKRPKVRKAAMAATVDMLRLHAGKRAWTLGQQVADFSNNVLAACTASDCLPTLHLLGFLQEVKEREKDGAGMPFLPEEAIPMLAERILRLQSLESTMVVQASLQTLRALVKAEAAPLSPDTVQAIAEAAMDVQPPHDERDPEVCIAFCELVAASLERLVLAHGGQRAPARALLTRAMQALVARCEAPEAAVVHECACSAMRRVLCLCTGEEDVRSLPPEEQRHVTEALAAVGKLLDFRYHKAWGVGLPFLGSLFIHFKQGSAGPLLDPLLQKLVLLHDTVLSSAPKLVRPFEKCVALAVEGLGIEKVLEVLPLEESEGGLVTGRRAWLLPVLAAHGKRQPCHLSYFQTHILELAQSSNEVVAAGKGHAKPLQQQRQRVLQLWALLPAFCAQPRDVAAAFGTLAPALANALQDPQGMYPELLTPVCLGLQALVRAVREANDAGMGGASEAGAEADLATVAALSKKLLPTLFASLDGTPLEEGSAAGVRVRTLSDAISAYAQVAPKAFVASLFKKLVHKMLEATSRHQQGGEEQGRPIFDAGGSNSKAVVLCELALALVPSLDAASLALLYKVVRPLVRLQDRDVALQKRAYRVLGALCEHQAAALLTREALADLLPLLTESLLTCHVSARQMRLRVLTAVITKLDPDSQEHWALLAGLVGEVLLCLKDANGKAREAAYGALSAMARVRAEQQEDLADFVQVVLAALAAETPHMRSAAVLALAHLVFEFAPQAPAFRSSIPDLLATVLLLGADPAKEVVKAVVSFVRICVAACPPHELEPLLPAVVQCLFASNSKVRFRAKVKIILKKLCRRFGYDAVLALAPESDRKLVHHIQKQAARGERIAASQAARSMDDADEREEKGGHGHRQRKFERMLEDDEDSSGDEDEEDDGEAESECETGAGKARQRRQQGVVVAERRKLEKMALVRETGGIIDLLDSAMLKNLKLKGGGTKDRASGGRAVVGKRGREMVWGSDTDSSGGKQDDDDDDDEPVEFNAEGKLVVLDDNGPGRRGVEEKHGFDFADAMREDAAESDEDGPRRSNKRQRRGYGGESQGSQPRRQQQQQQQQQRSMDGGKGKAPGAAYKNKKAGGDVRGRGQLEPYAYVPLNPKMLSKRNKSEAAATFGAVVGSTKARREERKHTKARSRRGASNR